MSKLKLFIRESWLLIVLSFVFGLLLAVAQAAWSPLIEQNKIRKLNTLMSGLLGDAEGFDVAGEVNIVSPRGSETTINLYRAEGAAGQTVGYCFIASGPGFADKIELVVALDANLDRIAGFDVLSSNETPGFGERIKSDYYHSQFAGAPAQKLQLVKAGDAERIDSEIVAITGATVSSQAVVTIINNIVPQIKAALSEKKLTAE